MLDHYKLNEDGTTTKVSFEEYLAFMKNERVDPKQRIVRQVHVKRGKRKLFVSTVFLGMDHQWTPGAPPLIFETMIFGQKHALEFYCDRYTTIEQARAGHAEAVQYARKLLH